MTNTERLFFLAGQVAAHQAMFAALIRTHPHPHLVLEALTASIEIQKVGTIPTTAPEPYVEGQAQEYETLLALTRAATGP